MAAARHRCGGRPRCAGRGSRRGFRARPRSGRRASPAPGRSGSRSRPRRSPRSRSPRPRSARRRRAARCAAPALAGGRGRARGRRSPRRSGSSRRDGSPARPVAQAEHAVIVEELGHEAGRKAPHLLGVGRPDRRGLGDDQALDEVTGEAALLQPVPERGRGAVHPDQRPGLAVEAAPVAQHAEEGRAEQMTGTGEEAARRARVLEPPRPSETEKLMCEGWVATPSSASSRSKLG